LAQKIFSIFSTITVTDVIKNQKVCQSFSMFKGKK